MSLFLPKKAAKGEGKMKRQSILMLGMTLGFCIPSVCSADLIGPGEFQTDSRSIDFSDVQFTCPHFGNAAYSPITQYEPLGVTFYVHNDPAWVGTIHDVFRLGSWIPGQGLSIATNVGDDTSIELVFSVPVTQVGALVAVSNARLAVYGEDDALLEQWSSTTVAWNDDPGLWTAEFIGVENYSGIHRAIFYDISANGRILSIDDVKFTPVPAPGAFILGSIGVGFVTWLRRRKTL